MQQDSEPVRTSDMPSRDGTPQSGADRARNTSISSTGDATSAESTESGATQATLLVGIPAYNAAGSVGNVVRAATAHADLVLVVDDGSVDETASRAREAGATVVAHPVNSGYGAALKTIFREAAERRYDNLVIVDADGQHDASDVGRLAAGLVAADADVAVGSRFTDGGSTDAPPYRRVGLAVINTLTNLSLGRVGRDRIADTQSGFRAYSPRAVASLATDDGIGDRMDASLDILYHAASRDYEIVEVGTSVTYEVEHGSTLDPVSHGLELVGGILRRTAREYPVAVFGVVGGAVSLVTLARLFARRWRR
jgi:glycosyltransferase involved in cell wall biosynthesis